MMSQNLMLGILFSKDKEDLDYSVRHALVVGGSGKVPHAPGWRRDDWYKASAWTDAPLRVLVAARDTEMLQAFFDSYKRHKGDAQTMLFALTSLVKDAPSMYDWLMAHGGFAHLSPVAPAALSCRDKMYETLIEHHVKTGTTQAWDQWLRRYLKRQPMLLSSLHGPTEAEARATLLRRGGVTHYNAQRLLKAVPAWHAGWQTLDALGEPMTPYEFLRNMALQTKLPAPAPTNTSLLLDDTTLSF